MIETTVPAVRGELTERDAEFVAGQLRAIRHLVGITGTLVATTDGRNVLSDLTERSPGSAAAIAASSLGLGARLGELTSPDCTLLELQVRSDSGYVCLYLINASYVLGVVANHTVNLARLKLEVREVVAAISQRLGG